MLTARSLSRGIAPGLLRGHAYLFSLSLSLSRFIGTLLGHLPFLSYLISPSVFFLSPRHLSFPSDVLYTDESIPRQARNSHEISLAINYRLEDVSLPTSALARENEFLSRRRRRCRAIERANGRDDE